MDRLQAVAYCAGFFDGEGCISLESVPPGKAGNRHGSPRVEFRLRCITSQKYADAPLHLMADTFGGKVYWFAAGRAQHIVHGRASVAMLTEMLPFLTVKRSQAELALTFFEMSNAERGEALTEMRRLKKVYDIKSA